MSVASQATSIALPDPSVELSGTLTIGNTLTGIVNDDPGGGTWKWYRNGVAIGGATASTYLLVSADGNKGIMAGYTVSAVEYFSIEAPVLS